METIAFVNELVKILEGTYSPWQSVFEIWPSIQALGVKPFKDGDQWCFLYGDNIQDGIAGFGETIRDAAIDFYNNLCYEKTNGERVRS